MPSDGERIAAGWICAGQRRVETETAYLASLDPALDLILALQPAAVRRGV
jgi:hypothetical protein